MTAQSRLRHAITPRLLRRERASAYLDISPAHFDKLVARRILPAPKRLDDRIKGWDTRDLDAAIDHLPYDGAAAPDAPSDWD